MSKIWIIFGLAILFITVAGCLNAEINTKVNKDYSGTRDMHIEISKTVYNMMPAEQRDFLDDRLALEKQFGGNLLSYNKQITGDWVIYDIKVKGNDLRKLPNVSISKTGGNKMRFEEKFIRMGMPDPTFKNLVQVTYRVEMPTKIISSNGDKVIENVVTWYFDGASEEKTMWVESETPAIPGFTLIPSLIVIALTICILKKNKSSNTHI